MSTVRAELPVLPEPRLELRRPDVDDAVAVAALLAEPVRAGILAMLRDGPLPLTGWVKKGPMARLAVAILQETLRVYWRLVRGFV